MSAQRLLERWHAWRRICELRRMLESGRVTDLCWINFLKLEIEELEADLRVLEAA
ncbi:MULTISPECIES: hypothetical protein [Paenibacillus]|uniref:hypothetical protein n=1 Tax=Paenibacillus TaxID=44249 RepID=UPI0015A76BC2|nr:MULTISPECIES: hypothetical protein [Paenibacillus]MCM3701870.1 hypothetical protein [Paenibacillus macerans]